MPSLVGELSAGINLPSIYSRLSKKNTRKEMKKVLDKSKKYKFPKSCEPIVPIPVRDEGSSPVYSGSAASNKPVKEESSPDKIKDLIIKRIEPTDSQTKGDIQIYRSPLQTQEPLPPHDSEDIVPKESRSDKNRHRDKDKSKHSDNHKNKDKNKDEETDKKVESTATDIKKFVFSIPYQPRISNTMVFPPVSSETSITSTNKIPDWASKWITSTKDNDSESLNEFHNGTEDDTNMGDRYKFRKIKNKRDLINHRKRNHKIYI